jgi:hypothetical protein
VTLFGSLRGNLSPQDRDEGSVVFLHEVPKQSLKASQFEPHQSGNPKGILQFEVSLLPRGHLAALQLYAAVVAAVPKRHQEPARNRGELDTAVLTVAKATRHGPTVWPLSCKGD